MELTKIFLIVLGVLILIEGVLITTIPEKVRAPIKNWLSLPDNLFCLPGYILGVIGIAAIVIALTG
jgi:uncharacterized protein YjeT (DUF2065 family)